VKVGKVDANSEFAYVENGGEFLNFSMSVSPTIFFAMPTIPNSSTSINLFVNPIEELYVSLGIYDGAKQEGKNTGTHGTGTFFNDPADLFLIGEVGGTWSGKDEKYPGRIGAGVWHHNGTFDRFDELTTESGTSGFYLVLDQTLWSQEGRKQGEGQTVDAFLQYGFADEAVSDVKHHFGSGLVWNGPFGRRENDAFGLGATWVDFSNEPLAGYTEPFEIAYEMFYKFQICENFSLKPDIQYIVNPGGDKTINDATVTTVRLELSF